MTPSRLLSAALALLGTGCGAEAPLFTLRLDTGVTFSNTLHYAYEFNVYRYRNFYNGGGVALGDVNGDGLLDIFLTANQGSNALFLNRGDWTFEDATKDAGLSGRRAWTTGVSMADINGDGWLDIYVCNAGIADGDDKRNELYINRRDGTFAEMAAAYGIDDAGLSVHGTFLDFDLDGDLDLYLVNNSFRSIEDFDQQHNTRHLRHAAGGDRLFRNDGARFTDVSATAGIHGSEIGFGLGASVGDVNRDGWPDIYVSNDFFERDYLYINRGDGTFEESLERSIKSVSAAAMGADMADLDGDGYLDIFVTDMLPVHEVRLKTVTSFDSWPRYQRYLLYDYYHQFTRNTLQKNQGGPPRASVHFAEIGRYAGVAATDWSWGALIADFDHDGYRDIFVANGIYQDLTNADYLVEANRASTIESLVDQDSVDWQTLIDMMPSNPIPNHMFAGDGALRFADVTARWGLDAPGFSNGSAYGDLDNDGDLDLVINNVNQRASLYENRATDHRADRAWLQLSLRGEEPNTQAVGAQVTAWHQNRRWYVESQPVRGFQSSVDPVLHLGLGSAVVRLDSIVVRWPGNAVSVFEGISTGQRLTLAQRAEEPRPAQGQSEAPWLQSVSPRMLGLDWRHAENAFNDFEQQPLLFHMRSTEGPALCAGDANGDGRQDLYLGGARGQEGTLALQNAAGGFVLQGQPSFLADSTAEDTRCLWRDMDADGDQDLYVASGGTEFPGSSSALVDRIYENDGHGRLRRLPSYFFSGRNEFEPTGAVAAADIDDDGDIDLFVGARLRPFAYGKPADGHLLSGDGAGRFVEVTDRLAPALRAIGMITDAAWADMDGNGAVDLIVAGEWMPLTVLFNENGTLQQRPDGLEQSSGWWQSVHVADLDGDQDLDLIAGNHGLNSRFRAPLAIWTADFDRSGSTEQIIARHVDGRAYPMALRHDLIEQIPALVHKFPTYASFAGATVADIFTEAQLTGAEHRTVRELRSIAFINDGQGRFTVRPLPMEAQLSPVYAALAVELTGDDRPEVLLGGNLYEAKPEVGRYDASFGTVLSSSQEALPWRHTGFWIDGAARKMVHLPELQLILVGMNNDSLRVFSYAK